MKQNNEYTQSVSRHPLRCWLLFLPALVSFISLIGCKGENPAKLPDAPKPAEVPQYLGVYLTDGGKLTRLDTWVQEPVKGFSPKTALILYHQSAGVPGVLESVKLQSVFKVRFSVNVNNGKVIDLRHPHEQWMRGTPTDLPLLAKPMEKPNMMILVPEWPLSPSYTYRVTSETIGIKQFHFTVGKTDSGPIWDEWSHETDPNGRNFRKAKFLDQVALEWQTEIKSVIDSANELLRVGEPNNSSILRKLSSAKETLRLLTVFNAEAVKPLQDVFDKLEAELQKKVATRPEKK